jgi:hypothetical protein
MSTACEKTKKILYDKLTAAEKVISEIMVSCSLTPNDKIALLLSNIQVRIHGMEDPEDETLSELQDLYVNLIIGVMSQDMLESTGEIGLLHTAIRKRIEDFDLYFEKLEKGTLKGPF